MDLEGRLSGMFNAKKPLALEDAGTLLNTRRLTALLHPSEMAVLPLDDAGVFLKGYAAVFLETDDGLVAFGNDGLGFPGG